MTEISVFLAFGAGVLSFLSPCVLPLIPSWLCIIGGAPLTGNSDTAGELKTKPVARTVSFIFGFSAVFIVLSIVFSATFSLIGGVSFWINLISGIVVIVLGLNIIFNFLSFLNYEKRFHLNNKPRGIIGAFLAGGAFGAGWTPCVGPVLGGILLLAANSGGIPRAALYLVFYSAGLGLPFLLAAFSLNAFLKISVKLRAHLPLIQRISGALLIVIGVLIVTGRYQALSVMAAGWQAKLQAKTPAALSYEAINVEASIADNKVPADVIRAFREAGIPVAAEGITPVDFSLPLVSGKTLKLSDLKGKVIFLNFWATWCGPCRAEMPSMEEVYKELKHRDFEILSVNLRESKDMVSAFMLENKLTFPAVLDERGVTGSYYNVQAIPTTYIIDKRGLVVARLVGSIDWNTPKIISALEILLNN
ncbi:MAG: redoxin domain-containing protein [Treponema sp.]|jgi:cytochrome c-type biogenesis protein|nr:redoxin domain-containing protein [Treponema sp.]